MIPTPVIEAINRWFSKTDATQPSLSSITPVGGGSINKAYSFIAGGNKFFIKINLAARYPGMFEAEARGLEILNQTGSIEVPRTFLSENAGIYSFLLMNFAAGSQRKPGYWQDTATQLANLHKKSHTYFGLDHNNYIGSLKQINTPTDSWIDFLINFRLLPMIQMAGDAQLLNRSDYRNFDLLFTKLENLIPKEPPALLHGDLWSGNLIAGTNGSACFIDPAVYYGHREMDLAMTRLFGGFPGEFYQHYDDVFPLEKEWNERIDLNQLYPLLVHVNLFGGGYATQVRNILKRYV